MSRTNASTVPMLVVMFGVASLGFSGCSQPKPATPQADEIPNRQFPNVTLIRISSDEMAADQPIITPAQGGAPMAVRVPVRSLIDTSIVTEYRFLFYTSNMDSVTMSPMWHEVVFGPLQRHVLQANSISDKAVNWTLEIRRK